MYSFFQLLSTWLSNVCSSWVPHPADSVTRIFNVSNICLRVLGKQLQPWCSGESEGIMEDLIPGHSINTTKSPLTIFVIVDDLYRINVMD